MDFNFTAALRELNTEAPGGNAAFTMMNQARVPGGYVLAQFLPERRSASYDINSGQMVIRAVMAGLVGMDSPYPEGSIIDTSTFMAQSAKIAHAIDMPEHALRAFHDILMHLQINGGNVLRAQVQEVTNFTDKLLIQPHMDTSEWLRGQALQGAIDWTFNKKRVLIDYKIPAANKITPRTGNDGYGGTASKFWPDLRLGRKQLRQNPRAIVMHPDTFDMILFQEFNRIEVLSQTPGLVRIRRLVQDSSGGIRAATDARDTVDIVLYGLEGEVIDAVATQANGGVTVTKRVPFLAPGVILYLGQNTTPGYVVGAGSQVPTNYELGYTHVGPTVEGNGMLGPWARVFTPEGRPWALRGEAVQNTLPVIDGAKQIVILTTEMV